MLSKEVPPPENGWDCATKKLIIQYNSQENDECKHPVYPHLHCLSDLPGNNKKQE
jgi:hypothetical protein